MDRLAYIAMSGARQIMQKQATNNHNLANLNTSGFKAEFDTFNDRPVYGPGYPGRVYTENDTRAVDFTEGSLISTGNPLDVAINGSGFIAVQDAEGNEAYTRMGELRVTAEGLLTTADGRAVLGNGGPITLTPYQDLMIGNDGTITIQPLGQAAGELAVLDRIKLVNPDTATMTRGRDGLFRSAEGDLPADAAVSLEAGMLETSNVNSVEAMVNMISLARQYETQVKMMSTAEENDRVAGRLMQNPG